MNIKKLVCASLGALVMSSYVTAESTAPQNGDMAFLALMEDRLLIQYDTDNNGITDTLYVYQILGKDKNGYVVNKLESIAKDKNNDGKFTIDEIVWMNGEPV